MPLFFPLLVFFLLFASPTLSEPVPFTVLDEEFHNYLRSSESVPLSQKHELWLQLLEKPHDKIYSSYLPQDADARRKLVLPWLETYQELGEEIQESFPVVVRDTKVQLKAFRDKFPALSDSYSVIILPALSFNGKTARVDGKQVLMLGVDQIVKRKDHLGILVSHELFHIYHEQVWGGPRTDAVTLTWPLWVEGLATYASQSFGPQAEIFMDDELAALDDPEIPWLAERYLQISETTKGDPDAGRIYGEWYLASPKTRVREDLPPRLGYFLGYHVVKALSTSYSVDTMARWTPSEAHRAMKLGLRRLIAEGD